MSESAGRHYHGKHRPMEDGAPLWDMTQMFGEDVYTNPQWYAFGEHEAYFRDSIRVFLSVRNKPQARVRIFRAVPKECLTQNAGAEGKKAGAWIEKGDWIALSKSYCKMHAMNNNNPEDDDVVVATIVAARNVRSGSGDLIEWGWWGNRVFAEIA